ncbi:hypothetical protein KI387_036586, partial [Taxus chinensis]
MPEGSRHRRSSSLGKDEVTHQKASSGLATFLENKEEWIMGKLEAAGRWEFIACLAG